MKHLLPAVQRTALRIPWAAVGGCAAALLLTAAAPGGQYAPWALAAVAAAGGDGRACWRWSARGWAPCCSWTFSRGCGIPPRHC